MIDHVLGRPSVKFRKYQVFAVLGLWSLYLYKGDANGPPAIRRLSALLSRRLTVWQTVVITLLWLYIARNFGKLVSLECPEPLANLYSRAYFRATWVTTALDAGFWTAMKIRPKWARDLLSVVFSAYYLIAAEQADEKVRKVRGMLTVDHLRVSWNKPLTPYLKFITAAMRPRFMKWPPRKMRIQRPQTSVYTEPINAWLYFEGPLEDLKNHDKIVLDIPGGGFVAMSPRTHDDKLMAWAGKTGLPVLSLDYKKAPEFPYPYALNECYDAYHKLIATHGKCIGMSGNDVPRIVVSGDSAGGNLAAGLVLMILQSASDPRRWHGEKTLPFPDCVLLIYPALDCNIGNWMTDEQMALINDRRNRNVNKAVLSRKSQDYRNLTPSTPHHSSDEMDDDDSTPESRSRTGVAANDSVVTVVPASELAKEKVHPAAAHIPNSKAVKSTTEAAAPKPVAMKTRLAMSSMISYFNDRVLGPEMMRAMIILYIGPHNRPDFSTDYLLSPLLAPDSLLAVFPKTYIITGERDPLVDDTVIFAGRLRQAQRARHLERQEVGAIKQSQHFRESEVVQVALIPGISHGFLQFPGVFPDGWKYISRCADWILDGFDSKEDIASGLVSPAEPDNSTRRRSTIWDGRIRHHRRKTTDSSGDEFDKPLEMTRLNQSSASLARKSGSGSEASSAKKDNIPNSRQNKPSLQARRQQRESRKSLVSLASEDDLLGRRMKGLAGGLMGMDSESELPPTP
ncbi:alpha/beta-hydrolase [Microthyrium microscopicum]|uniref:Alpha/beta-hydrolase n=1 Tax=Microthyrium microscopicum TaxID=703497 RepID=A0A6A6U7L4_9PEZI|nr:alpha/beta-hydrolase [Microthyrium microscopicum]